MTSVEERYHAPSSSWPGNHPAVHLHVLEPMVRRTFRRSAGETLCAKRRGNNEQPVALAPESAARCERCDYYSRRFGISWPSERRKP